MTSRERTFRLEATEQPVKGHKKKKKKKKQYSLKGKREYKSKPNTGATKATKVKTKIVLHTRETGKAETGIEPYVAESEHHLAKL